MLCSLHEVTDVSRCNLPRNHRQGCGFFQHSQLSVVVGNRVKSISPEQSPLDTSMLFPPLMNFMKKQLSHLTHDSDAERVVEDVFLVQRHSRGSVRSHLLGIQNNHMLIATTRALRREL